MRQRCAAQPVNASSVYATGMPAAVLVAPMLLLLCCAGANGDIAVISGVLQTANSIFKRYRDQYRSNALVNELQKTQVRGSGGQLGTGMY